MEDEMYPGYSVNLISFINIPVHVLGHNFITEACGTSKTSAKWLNHPSHRWRAMQMAWVSPINPGQSH